MNRKAEASPPAVVCDLDGVVWLGGEVIPGAAQALSRLREAGFPIAFLTNNSSLSVRHYARRLDEIGIPVEPGAVLTSALAAANLLAGDLASGSRVLACAGEGVVEALTDAGFEVVPSGPCEAVVVGWHRTFDLERLARASAAVRDGARFVATNIDPTLPGPDGLMPGAGALVAAVATASGREPEVAGKPEPPTVALVRARVGEVGVMVGDRPSTDGALAAALGWRFALVVSDATHSSGEPDDGGRADWVAADLAGVVDALLAGESQR